MRPLIVATRPLVGDWEALLSEVGDLSVLAGPEGPSRDRLLAGVSQADALVCWLTDVIDAEVLAAAPRLRVVGNCAVGVDNLDVGAAHARGITLCYTPGVLNEATADLTWALILAAARRLVEGDRYLREGRFEGFRLDLLLGLELSHSCLGILGLGRIGRAVARRARGFGCRVLYWGRGPAAEEASEGATFSSLEALLGEADVVSIHLPLAESTRGLLSRQRLGLMKPGAILINTARGAIVDEEALVDLLESGQLGAAGLDVYAHEPAVPARLLACPHTVLLPHIGSATWTTRRRMAEGVCRDVARVLRGEPPQCALGSAHAR